MRDRKQACQLLCWEKGEAGREKSLAEDKVADSVFGKLWASVEYKVKGTVLSWRPEA